MQNGPAVSLDGRQPRERTAPAMERTSAAPATAAADAGCVPETAADTPRGQAVYLNVRPPPPTDPVGARVRPNGMVSADTIDACAECGAGRMCFFVNQTFRRASAASSSVCGDTPFVSWRNTIALAPGLATGVRPSPRVHRGEPRCPHCFLHAPT